VEGGDWLWLWLLDVIGYWLLVVGSNNQQQQQPRTKKAVRRNPAVGRGMLVILLYWILDIGQLAIGHWCYHWLFGLAIGDWRLAIGTCTCGLLLAACSHCHCVIVRAHPPSSPSPQPAARSLWDVGCGTSLGYRI
jgi:hypothetical protein